MATDASQRGRDTNHGTTRRRSLWTQAIMCARPRATPTATSRRAFAIIRHPRWWAQLRLVLRWATCFAAGDSSLSCREEHHAAIALGPSATRVSSRATRGEPRPTPPPLGVGTPRSVRARGSAACEVTPSRRSASTSSNSRCAAHAPPPHAAPGPRHRRQGRPEARFPVAAQHRPTRARCGQRRPGALAHELSLLERSSRKLIKVKTAPHHAGEFRT